MPELTVPQAFDHAVALHNAGRAAKAESVYRQILAIDPAHLDAMQMLGVLLAQTGRPDEGLELVRSASRLNPAAASCHANIGMILAGQGKLEEAVGSFRHALSLRPDSPETLSNLANALGALGRHEEAVDAYRQSIALNPRFTEAYSNLGTALCTTEQAEEGIACFHQAITINPDYVEAHFNLAKALYENRHLEAALESVQRALSLRPNYAEALMLNGALLQSLGHHDAAIESYQQSLALRPNDAETLNNLATAHLEQRHYDLALEIYRQAIAANPDNAEAHGNFGRALGEVGLLDESLAEYRKSLALKPQSRTASGMLLYLHLHPQISPHQILEEHCNWARTYTKPLAASHLSFPNDPSPNRRIKIAYVSPDFTYHPVGRFIFPILAHHDRKNVEVVCYSDTRATDVMTERLRAQADVWRDSSRLSDNELAAQVREDRIDLLIDLVMHSKGSRLLAFSQKPAPVQISYLAYASTTGIPQIDYRVSDPYLDLPDCDESVYSEKTLRLPNCFWCYHPDPQTPDVGPLPYSANGHITFGCLNNFWKITPPVLDLWIELLSRVPNSRLVLHAHEGAHRQRLRDTLASKNLDPDRITFVGFQPLAAYLEQHTHIDIALDPFPYGGGTTTCEALWMGAPVVTLPGQTAVSRAGLSILSNVDLTELVAQSNDHYLQLATDLASNPSRLTDLRNSLRDRMRHSPLMNAPQFARDLESLYRQAWQTWCQRPQGEGGPAVPMTAREHNSEGRSLARNGRTAEALEAFKRAVTLQPDFAEAHYNLAKALKDSGNLNDAADAYRRAVRLASNSGAAWQNLGNVLQELGRPDEAIDAYRHVLSLEPDNAGAHGMLARLLHQAGQLESSLPHFRALARLLPDNAEPLHALGVVLHDLGRLDEAAAEYRAALAIDPAHAHASYALGLIHLAQGDFQTGWKLYESRRRIPGPRAVRDFPQPLWDGSPLDGKTILLHAEQGLGDTLQFIRYAPLVTALGGHVLVQCPAPLVRLLQHRLTIRQVLPDGAPLPPFDLHCPLLSLSAVFQSTLNSIPAAVPYLIPDPADVAQWRARIEPLTGSRRKIGLAWSGSPGHRNDPNRSIPPDLLNPLTTLPNLALVSLQIGGAPPPDTLKASMIDLTAGLTDLSQTAALIANLDLVISVDTSVAHLAGALAKPTRLLLPYAPDWRWLLNRDDSPWYPTIRLFRQPTLGNWTEPLARLAQDLARGAPRP